MSNPPIYSSNIPSQVVATAAVNGSSQHQQQLQHNNIYCSSLNSASTTYCAYPHSITASMHPRPIVLQQQSQQPQQQQSQNNPPTAYSPHSHIYSPSSQSQSASSNAVTSSANGGQINSSSSASTTVNKAKYFSQHLQQGGCTASGCGSAGSGVCGSSGGLIGAPPGAVNCCYLQNCCKKRGGGGGEIYRSSSIDNF